MAYEMFGGQFLHIDLYAMAAAYFLFHLIKNHPFVDGNKRISTLLFAKSCKTQKINAEAQRRGSTEEKNRMPAGEQVIIQALNKQPPLALEQLQDAFGIEDILRTSKNKVFMISLLYFFEF